jgi:uncharacterized membrane protein YjgN (DUF898 family)
MAGRARAAVWLQIATHVHARDGVGLDYTRSEIAKLAALTQTTPTDDIALRVSPEDALIPKAVVGAASEGTSPVALIERRVEFRGNAREYFNIWIVNVALTLLTLGVYSAWAKVRTRRYLYGSVWLVGAPLDYQAKPLPILVGRAIGFVLFLAYVLGGRISPEFGLITPGVIALLAPWLIVRGLRFRARYSAWRGLNFGFAGSVGQSYVVFLLNYLLMPLSLGFAYPYIRAKQRHFVIAQHRFGSQHFAFDATVGDFYPIYLAAWALAFLGYLGLVGVMAVATRGWGVTGVWLALIASYFLYFSAFVYIAARVANLTFNKMRVGAMRFRSNVRARDLAGLYLGNTVAILLTLGLAVPWAVVRMARYRATQLVALVPEDLSGFVADSAVTEGAIGAEVADSFDVGVGI